MPQPKHPDSYRKPCSLCLKPRDVLVRCQIDDKQTGLINQEISSRGTTTDGAAAAVEGEDESPSATPSSPAPLKPGSWLFVCPGSCWKRVSGGVIDGDLAEGREGYRYGGMWKNKHAGVSAKVPRRLKGKLGREGEGGGGAGGAGGAGGGGEGGEGGGNGGKDGE